MRKTCMKTWMILGAISALVIWSTGYIALADHDGETHHGDSYREITDDHDRERKNGKHRKNRHHGDDDHRHSAVSPSVPAPEYLSGCGECHWAYPPYLLPAGSWSGILDGLEDHFGEAVDIDETSKTTILKYLEANAADRISGKLPAKIMKSIGSRTPSQITAIPYLRKEHHDIAADVFQRRSIGSPANCIACHAGADQGVYDDDEVTIPEEAKP